MLHTENLNEIQDCMHCVEFLSHCLFLERQPIKLLNSQQLRKETINNVAMKRESNLI